MGRWITESDGSKTWNPYRLKFYEDEHKMFAEAYSKELTQVECRIVFNKLCRHYKLRRRLIFNRRNKGIYNSWSIQLPNDNKIQFGLLIHEIAHGVDYKRRNKSKHDKKFLTVMKRINNYCKKKNWWEDELKRRTEIKIKPKPSELELQEKKIEKKKQDLIRYKKRLAYFTKLYGNKIKKANRSLAMLKNHYNKMNGDKR